VPQDIREQPLVFAEGAQGELTLMFATGGEGIHRIAP
jgi:hypothetical protein